MRQSHDLNRDAMDFWRRQRRRSPRGGRGYPGGMGSPLTVILIALLLVGMFLSSSPFLYGVPTTGPGIIVVLLVSAITPGGFLGLIFSGLFIWFLGNHLEAMDSGLKYMALFFVSGAVGAYAGFLMGGGFLSTVAPFGLAGAYAFVMRQRGLGGQGGATQWVIGLLAINALLSGFQPVLLVSMIAAFAAGFGFATVTRYGI